MAADSISGGAADIAEAHRRLLADKTLQFDLTSRAPPPTAKTPGWLEALGRFIEALSGPLEFLFWAAVALAVAMLLYFIVREATGARWQARFKRRKGAREAEAPDWRPSPTFARLQLAEADRLAALGQYDEAAHHLLLHTIQDVEDHRPRSIRPAYTSREIARMPLLPGGAREAFGRIAGIVETSLFGGRRLGAEAFAECRSAYEAFALAERGS
jgi:hypothetical protein